MIKIFNIFEIAYIVTILKRVLRGIDKDNGYNETEYELLKDVIDFIETR